MSQRCMPLLYINMAGEMLYILEQRLAIGSGDSIVDEEKAKKVLSDILASMFSKTFIDEIFQKPSELRGHAFMRQFFEHVAHSSIMRLNENSMDKLFDLMMMTVKYQIQQLVVPEQLLTLTMNHLDGMANTVKDNETIAEMIDYTHAMFMSAYRSSETWEWALIRSCLLNFFEGARVKVSLLLREGRQLESGHFVVIKEETVIPLETPLPGCVRYYEEGELTKTVSFPVKGNYAPTHLKDDFSLNGEPRSSTMGRNMYTSAASTQVKGGGGIAGARPPPGDELKLLSSLIAKPANDNGEFGMSLFDDESEEQTFAAETKKALSVKKIDAGKGKKTLSSAIQEMAVDGESKPKKGKGAAILDLMDEAAARPSTKRGRSPAKGPTGAAARPASRSSSATKKESRAGSRGGASPARPASKQGAAARGATPAGSRPASRAASAKKKPAP